jgi:hypothetical protein
LDRARYQGPRSLAAVLLVSRGRTPSASSAARRRRGVFHCRHRAARSRNRSSRSRPLAGRSRSTDLSLERIFFFPFFPSRTVGDFSVTRPCFLFIRCLPVLPACLAACLCSGRQAGRRQTGRTLVRTKDGLRQTLLLFCFALTDRSGPNILIPLDDRVLTQ